MKPRESSLSSYRIRCRLAMVADEILRENGSPSLVGCWKHRVPCQIFDANLSFGKKFRGLPSPARCPPRAPSAEPIVAKVLALTVCTGCGGPLSKFAATGTCRECYRNNAAKKYSARILEQERKREAVIDRFGYIVEFSQTVPVIEDHADMRDKNAWVSPVPDFAPALIETITLEEIARGLPIVFWATHSTAVAPP